MERKMSLEGLRSWDNQSLQLTHLYNTDVMLTAPPQTDEYMQRFDEVLKIAKHDPGMRPKIKYLLPAACTS